MAVVKGRVEPITMVEAPASLSVQRMAPPGHVPVAAAMPMIFSVNHQVVSFDGRFPVVAAVGDEILVAGTIKKDGMLHATAYENLTRAVGKTSVFPSFLMPALYISTAIGIPFFFWVMSLIQALRPFNLEATPCCIHPWGRPVDTPYCQFRQIVPSVEYRLETS